MLSSRAAVVTALGITQIISWGTIYYTISVLAKPMARDLGFSLTFIFLGFSLMLLLGGLLAPWTSRFQDRYGGRATMVVGSFLAAAGLGLFAVVQGPLEYLLAWFILGVAYRMTTYDAAFTTLVQLFGEQARRAISVLTLFGGVASTIFWPIGHYLDAAVGWRWTWAICALAVLVLCAPLHALLPGGTGRAKDPGSAGQATAPVPALVPEAERPFAIAMLGIALGLNSFVFTALSAHMIPTLEMLGVAVVTAVWIASMKGVFQTLGRLWELVVGARISPFLLALIATGGLPLAFLPLAALGPTLPALLVFSALYGASNGLVTIVRGGVPLSLFGSAGYAAVLARISAPGLIVTSVSPTAYAALIDSAGPIAGMLVLFVLSILSFAAIAVLAWRFRGRTNAD